MVGPALATAGANGYDPAAPADAGAVSMTLGTGATGATTLALRVDPAWLGRHAQSYPIVVDLPVMTADGYGQTGVFGTVNICAPGVAAPPTEMVVGVQGGCTYNGQVYFDLSALPNVVSIVSATLRLYTPGQTSATSVQVAQNVSPPDPYFAQGAPSWSTAPAVVTTTAPVSQSASAGGWQSWNVTGIMQGWINDQTTNGGFTLTGSGTPVRFASPLGAGSDAPALTPYLDITYGPQSGTSGSFQAMATTAAATSGGPYQDNAPFIYGVNGNVTKCPPSTNPACGTTDTGNIDVVGRNWPSGPGARLVRINTGDLPCTNSDPGYNAFQQTYQLMAAAYNDKLTPDVVLGAAAPSSSCPTGLTDNQWYDDTTYFVQHMSDTNSPLRSYPSLPPTYFEVGNEPNLPIKETPKYNGFQNYAERFYYATTGLYRALNTTYSGQKKAGAYYRILTGGVKSPDGEKGCKSGTIGEIALAIQKARANGPHGSVPTTNLGVAVHPYGFTTSSFKNYFAAHGNKSNICGNLGAMNRAWLDRFPNLPLVYTEINYSPGGSTNPLLQGSYLTDVMTYLYDTRSQQSTNTSTPYIVSGYDRLRVWWQEFIDTSGSATGLYTSGGTTTNKSFKVATCTNKTIHGGTSYVEPQVYFYLRNGHCY